MSEGDSSPEPLQVTIEVAQPQDALEMAKLKYANVMDRAQKGLIQLLPHEKDEAAFVKKDFQRILEVTNQTSEDNCYLVAKDQNGRVVGMCWMTWMPDTGRFQFKQFYVDPVLHRKGVGKKLFSKAKHDAERSQHSPKGIFLFTGDYNTAAREMYKKWGFTEAPREEWKIDTEPDGTQDIWVKMKLDFKRL